MAVDMLSALYRKKMYFFTDDDRGLEVQWYFCQDDAKDFPYPCAFVDGIWETKLHLSTFIGEHQADRSTLKVMATPVTATGQGPPCGTPEQWANGFPIGTFGGVTYDPLGIPTCCGDSNRDWGGGMGGGSCLFPSGSTGGGGMADSGISVGPITETGVLAKINTFTPGDNPKAVPAGVPQMVIVYVATMSGSGLQCVVTSALAGTLTPIFTAVGPPGQTFALSAFSVYRYAWSGAADLLTLSSIPPGGAALLVAVGFPGAVGTTLATTTASGASQPITQPMAATTPGAVYVCGALYIGVFAAPNWTLPFLEAAPLPTMPVWVNYDGEDFTIDVGWYVNPGGSVTAIDNPSSGTQWLSIGGVWV
jgi:hypothetical protein